MECNSDMYMKADHGMTCNSFILHCVLQAFCVRKGVTQFVIQKYEKTAHSITIQGHSRALFSYLTNHTTFGTIVLNVECVLFFSTTFV